MPSDKTMKLDAIGCSILDYVINLHCNQTNGRRSAYLALLCHADLLSRGARLVDNDQPREVSVLPHNWADSDPIRISYKFPKLNEDGSDKDIVQLAISQTDNDIFLNATNLTTDKLGHLELIGPAHVRLDVVKTDSLNKPTDVFLQLESTLHELEENLWKVVFPKLSSFNPSSSQPLYSRPPHDESRRHDTFPTDPNLRDYGRSDLDPLAGNDWTGSLGGAGGMVIDPTQALRRRPFVGIPDHYPGGGQGGVVPPGARFDPIGPPIMPPRSIGPRGSRFSNPDPDSAIPPGWEDMYM
nr:proteasome inhibitor [Hymenolepis microstoma]